MRYFLGVDGGNSKTYALLCDETGRFLALGRSGSSNHQSAGGIARAMAELAIAVDGALGQAGVAAGDVTHTVFCLAGADFASDYGLLEDAIGARWPGLAFTVRNDSFAGLRAGATRGWGVVSVAGTGNNQVGIAPDGRALQVGGMGYIYGDFGGGGDLGREAIRAVFMGAELRGPATALEGPVLVAMNMPSVAALGDALYHETYERGRIHRLAPLVFEAASEGDQAAQEILVRTGTLLGQSAGAVIRQLGLEATDVDVVLSGSTWKGSNPLMIDAFRLAVHRVAPRARLVRLRYEPVVGSWCLSVEAVGLKVTADMYRTLEETLPPELPVAKEGFQA